MKDTFSQNFKHQKFLYEKEVLITYNTNKICYWTEDSHGCIWSQAWLEFLTLYIFISYKMYTVSQTRSASIFTWNKENGESSLVGLLERASVNPVAVKILHVILYCVEDFGLLCSCYNCSSWTNLICAVCCRLWTYILLWRLQQLFTLLTKMPLK